MGSFTDLTKISLWLLPLPEVVTPPVGAVVESIPNGYEEIEIQGNTYYLVDDIQYKAVIQAGEVWYEVIKVG
ncbi:MAG: DUF6515 family protein [Bacteroidota bacterium]